MGSRGEDDTWQSGSWWTRQSHIHVQINWEEQLESEADHETQGSSARKESLKTSGCKNLWEVVAVGKLPVSLGSPVEEPTGS